ncbi:MAG: hypothetical protein JO020_15285 [Chloroflexi bacterium]|nr:hypothetical protein [Chloroflexota bacterium]MBV9895525.1 hypothetical protein [Chloroflexota bacterium]
MTVVRLQRNAPEAHHATTCAVCGSTDSRGVTDHLQAGTPGVPHEDAGVCENCGSVIDRVARKYGPDVTMIVEQAQTEASEREITTADPPARPGQSPGV